MDIIKDALYVNKEAGKRTFKNLNKIFYISLSLIVFGLLSFLFELFFDSLKLSSNILVGFLRYGLTMILYAQLLGVLDSIIKYNRVTKNDLISGIEYYRAPLMNTFFFYYLIEYLIYNFMNINIITIPGLTGFLIINFLLTILKSPLFEIIYIDGQSDLSAIKYSLSFLIENFLPWTSINIIFSLIFIKYLDGLFFMEMIFYTGTTDVVKLILALVLVPIVLIYKGHLFNILNGSSLRKRKFQGMF